MTGGVKHSKITSIVFSSETMLARAFTQRTMMISIDLYTVKPMSESTPPGLIHSSPIVLQR